MITKRSFAGAALWSLISHIVVAITALYAGIGFALILIYIRHGIIFRVPSVFDKWRRLIAGKEVADKLLALENRPWPTRAWLIGTAIYAIFTIIVFLKFNVRLIEVLKFR